MNTYTDGFVVPVPKNRVDDYKKLAELAAKVWMEHGALEYRECIADDTEVGDEMTSFPQLAGLSEDETVMFSWISYRDREHRDEVNAKAMAAPRLNEVCGSDDKPFDPKRLAYGGFRLLISS